MNIRDIARLANVTPGTVSKVLNNYPDISESTRAHVKQIIDEYQYAPTVGVKNTQSESKSTMIGLVIEGVYNSLYADMHQMISNRFHNAGCPILSYSDNYFAQDKTEKFEEILKYANDRKLTGLIYLGGSFANVDENHFNRLPCPTIFVDTVLPLSFAQTNYSSIQSNNYECGMRQMDILINKGHQNIVMMITSKDDISVYGLRYEGYKSALSLAKLTNNLDNVVEGQYIYPRTYENLMKFMKEHPEITAICISADIMAPAVLRVLYDLGRKPGEDIDIISFDGLELMDYTVPRVTGFQQPKQEMVDSIYDLLMGLMSNEKKHQHITFQNQIVYRETLK